MPNHSGLLFALTAQERNIVRLVFDGREGGENEIIKEEIFEA